MFTHQSSSRSRGSDLESKSGANIFERQLSSRSSSGRSSRSSQSSSNSDFARFTQSHADALTIITPLPPMELFHEDENGEMVQTKAKTQVLREHATSVHAQWKREFRSKSEDILTTVPTCYAFFDFIATERLRSVPHKGSKWDRVLKFAESYGSRVDVYANVIRDYVPHSWESAKLVWGSCQALLQMGPERVVLLEKVFNVLCQMGYTLEFFLKQKHLFPASIEIRNILAYAFADLVRFTVEVTIYYRKNVTVLLGDFDVQFGRTIDQFFERKESFTSESWSCILRKTTASSKSSITIRTLREWLAPQDRTLQIFLSDRLGTRTARIEFTCEWFDIHLRTFQRNISDVLWVFGKAGTGKSVLTGWILEKLKRTQNQRNGYAVISFAIDANLKSQRSSLSVVKSLCLQLLERNVGDLELHKLLTTLYERTEKRGVIDNFESALWKAFDSGLKKTAGRLMIVIDGIDHLDGGEHAISALWERLRDAAKHQNVKAILVSRPMSKTFSSDIERFVIESSTNSRDILRYVDAYLLSAREFGTLKEEERRSVMEKVTKICTGSYVWAEYLLQLLKTEKTVPGILNAADNLPKTLPEILQRLCQRLDLKKGSDARFIVSVLLASERPVTVQELKSIFELDVNNCSRSPRVTNIEEDIRNCCGTLVTIRDGLVCFSHVSIKEHLLDLVTSKHEFTLSLQEAQAELLLRCLAYLKLTLKDIDHEPTLGGGYDTASLTRKHHFFEYAARHYLVHFKRTSMYQAKGTHNCSPTFKKCFPDSAVLALIEGSWWETQTSASDAVELHILALQLRKIVLGDRHKAVAQCYINIARTRQNLSFYAEASENYHLAWEIFRETLGENHAVTRTCAKSVITCIESVTTKRTETIIKRTEIIYKYIHTHSETFEERLKYAKALAELYVHLKRSEEAVTIYRAIRSECLKAYGEQHEETMVLTRAFVHVLEITGQHEERIKVTESLLVVLEKTLEVWEETRITACVQMIEVYESRKDIRKAEEILITLRKGIVEACKHRHEEHIHESKIKITVHYVQFLRRQSRDEEAGKILIELWDEFKGYLSDKETHGDGILLQISIIGHEAMKSKTTTVAESVFAKLWSYYKKVGRHTSSEATVIAIALSSFFGSRSETVSEEEILREIFKASITKTVIDITVIKTCLELSSFCERQKRWSEAIDVCYKSLEKIWPSLPRFLGGSRGDVCSLPVRYHEEAIIVARRLAVCYHKEGRIDKAESVYHFIFHASQTSLKIHDERIFVTAEYFVRFYESIGKVDKAIETYHRLFEEYQEVLGASHTLSVKVTYALARFCQQHQPRRAERYYIAIITALTHGHEEYEEETIEAVLVLCKIYEQDKKFKDALKLYEKLWRTFYRRGQDCGMSSEIVMEVYQKYVFILLKESQGSIVHGVTVQFREACIKHYGKYHRITVYATVELAKILERDEKTREDALNIYEEIRKIISEHSELRLIMQKTIVDIRKRLAHLYSAHSTTNAKAEVIYLESWEEYKTSFGCTHKESLHRLQELITFFRKQEKKESIQTAISILQVTVIEIITKEREPKKLFDSAVVMAKLYLELGHKEHAFELLREIRLQLISTEVKTSTKFGFSLPTGHTLDRRSFVFAAALEETLKGSPPATLFDEIMHDLMTEVTLFESWMRTRSYSGDFQASLSVGSRLRLFLLNRGRSEECDKVTDELWQLFLAGVGEKTAKKSGIIWELFIHSITEMGVEGVDLTLLDTAATSVVVLYEKEDFGSSFELAHWIYKYIKVNHGGFVEQQNLDVGFKLSLCMAGRTSGKKCLDEQLRLKMMELSKNLLAEVLKASESDNLSFSKMNIDQVNLLVGLLGDQKNYASMERIIRDLWRARLSRISWSGDILVSIGCRLCEVLWIRGLKEEAITLCEDISYNLRQVAPRHALTITAYNLLSSFHTSKGRHEKSMSIHVDMLRDAISDEDENEPIDLAATVFEQLNLLKHSYQRHGKWDRDAAFYSDLWEKLEEFFPKQDVRNHALWGKVDNIKIWMSQRSSSTSVGTWVAPGPPRGWCFLPDPAEKKAHLRHHHCSRHGHENGQCGMSSGHYAMDEDEED